MSDGPKTEKILPLSDRLDARVNAETISSDRSTFQLLNLLGGLILLIGLLVWIWSSDWRWAATGLVVAIAFWSVTSYLERPRK